MTKNERTQRSARRLDREKVAALAKQGLSTADIAAHQKVAPSTVFRFLQQTKPERAALESFKKNRGDAFARLAMKSLNVQEAIVDSLDDAVVSALPVHQKGSLLHSLSISSGILFDKERLERGQSTNNLAVLGQLIVEAESRLGLPPNATVTPQ